MAKQSHSIKKKKKRRRKKKNKKKKKKIKKRKETKNAEDRKSVKVTYFFLCGQQAMHQSPSLN